jgi:hypothetical protein
MIEIQSKREQMCVEVKEWWTRGPQQYQSPFECLGVLGQRARDEEHKRNPEFLLKQ